MVPKEVVWEVGPTLSPCQGSEPLLKYMST